MQPVPEIILAEVRTLFTDAALPGQAPAMQVYMKNIAPFLGLKAPARKAIEKEIFRQYQALPFADLEVVIRALITQPEREFHYLAMDWLHHRRKDFGPETIDLIDTLLTTHSWWDTVDFLAPKCLGYWATRFPEVARPVLHHYIQSPDFWINRAAILHQLDFKTKTDTQLLAATMLPHLTANEFFLRKGIGWALRQYARTNPDWVIDFVKAHPQLSPLSKREALRRIVG